jgi:hypothetical protein
MSEAVAKMKRLFLEAQISEIGDLRDGAMPNASYTFSCITVPHMLRSHARILGDVPDKST